MLSVANAEPDQEGMRTPQVLVVDDDEDYARVVTRLFERVGHTQPVTVVHDEATALQLLRTTRFDVVVSDFELRPGNGLRVLEHVRDHHAEAVRILITSAPDAARAQMRSNPPAAHDVWDKHWPLDRIQSHLDRLLRDARPTR